MLKHKASIASPQVLKPLILLLLALLVAGAAAGVTLSLTQAQSANGVYDTDGDKLIEITYLEQLAAIAYDLDGDGEADNTVAAAFYSLAFPVEADESVCDSDCKGYELTKSLDFKKNRQLQLRRPQPLLDRPHHGQWLDSHNPPGRRWHEKGLRRHFRGQRLLHCQPVQQRIP